MTRVLAFIQQSAHLLYRSLAIERHELLYLFFEITRRCNMRCRHCGSDCSSSPQSAELDTASWLRITDYIAARFNPKPAIVLTGGEPLVHPGLDRIVERLAFHGFAWGVVTNGMLLTEDLLARLIDQNVSSVTVSLDGGRDAHTYIRSSPLAYDRALAAVRALGASAVQTRDVVSCVYGANLLDLDDTAEVLLEAGINSWRLFRIFPLGRAATNPNLALSYDQTHELLDWIGAARPGLRRRGLELSYSCEGYLPFTLDRAVRDEPFFCRSGVNFASILSDGTVTGCNNNPPTFYQGTVLESDFAKLWNEGFGNLRNREWMRTGPCAQCREWRNCLGGSVHLRHGGDLDAQAPSDSAHRQTSGLRPGSASDAAAGPIFCYVHDLTCRKSS